MEGLSQQREQPPAADSAAACEKAAACKVAATSDCAPPPEARLAGGRLRSALQAPHLAHRIGPLFDFVRIFRDAGVAALDHDAATVAQATAYSAIIALFPALIVIAAAFALLPASVPLRANLSLFFDRILPSNTLPVLETYFATQKSPRTTSAILGSLVVSLSGASSVMATLMEGFRRAHNLPANAVGFWRRRARSLALVPISLLPMTLASTLVVFGFLFSQWIVAHAPHSARLPVLALAFAVRYTLSLAGSVAIVAVIYHLGTDLTRHMREHMQPFLQFRIDWSWRASLPGAAVATVLWFASTLAFGLYVTRFANYNRVYGSLGAGIALLFWLYLIAFSVLFGAEFNAQRTAHRIMDRRTPEAAAVQALPPAARPRAARQARQHTRDR